MAPVTEFSVLWFVLPRSSLTAFRYFIKSIHAKIIILILLRYYTTTYLNGNKREPKGRSPHEPFLIDCFLQELYSNNTFLRKCSKSPLIQIHPTWQYCLVHCQVASYLWRVISLLFLFISLQSLGLLILKQAVGPSGRWMTSKPSVKNLNKCCINIHLYSIHPDKL